MSAHKPRHAPLSLETLSPRRLSSMVVWTRDHDRLVGLLCALVALAIQLL